MAGEPKVTKKYVSKKIKTIRWKPPTSNFEKTNTFVTGSWDDEENVISVWQLLNGEGEPNLEQSIPYSSNVNDIQYVTRDVMVAGGGAGHLTLYEHDCNTRLLSEKLTWKDCHQFYKGSSAPCTAVATNGELIASVGEDGKLVILNPSQNDPVNTIDSGSGCSDYAVVFVRASEVLTANMQGHLKLWDLRANGAAKANLLSPDQVSVCHLSGHPTQQHLIAAGSEDGTLSLWDMRATSQPLTMITAHSSPVTEVKFHQSSPDHLFTCGLDGQLILWDAAARITKPRLTTKPTKEPFGSGSSVNAWLSCDVARGVVDTTCLMPKSPLPINTLDVEGSTLVAGSDNEAIFVVQNVILC